MKIALAQINPKKGEFEKNISKHIEYSKIASTENAEIVVFPELSLIGYEPILSDELATSIDDARFDELKEASTNLSIAIVAGFPLRSNNGINIAMGIFEPNKDAWTYSKQFLHVDEKPFFVSGERSKGILKGSKNIGLGICYELSVQEHIDFSLKNGADIYLASVAKHANGVAVASKRLSSLSQEFEIPSMMVNCVGFFDGVQCTGNSSVWNANGDLLGRMDNDTEGILFFDTDSGEVFTKSI